MNKELVKQLITEAVADNESLFLLDWSISTDNGIEVIVDGDEGLPLSEVVRISRHIEHNLDREEADFSLKVMSPGATEPLKVLRQFQKNKGRKLKVRLNDGSEVEGTMTEVTEESITLEWKAREPKPIGKGKHTVEKKQEIAYSDIVEARVVIIF